MRPGQPPWASMTSSISAMMRMVSLRATTNLLVVGRCPYPRVCDPDELTRELQLFLGGAVVAVNAGVYFLVLRRGENLGRTESSK